MAVRAAEGLPVAGQQGAVKGQGPQLAVPGGQDVFPAGTKAGTASAKPTPSTPRHNEPMPALSGTPVPAVKGKDLARPERAQREAG